ncbi:MULTISPECIES: 2-keto-4-pentenoate hydratase [unclassified Streptomyces]|uniref:2-keto-4-pentenoate hydratase n=1 Tax=unclassified Streptomyces TaxID=2593676 RepID=UPI00278BD049|nr:MULTISPECIES: fumarylacetoacetate hydrolase family protein [unclassified Streptomyces]
MTASTVDTAALAAELDDAAREGRLTARPSDRAPITVEQAYDVQRAVFARRLARGESAAGVKMGFTSRAKMAQMGIDDVIWGLLSTAMRVADGNVLDASALVHPRIEPEIAFRIGHRLSGPVSPEEAARAVDGVCAAYEVLDSRYEGFDFTLPDVIADNASAAAFGCGPWHAPSADVDLADLGLRVEIDGQTAATGSSAAILGDPLRSLAAAARLAGAAGTALEPGHIVLAGAATAAVPLPRGARVRVEADRLGCVEAATR